MDVVHDILHGVEYGEFRTKVVQVLAVPSLYWTR